MLVVAGGYFYASSGVVFNHDDPASAESFVKHALRELGATINDFPED
ncbi:hypothetical protein ACIRQF_07130 [Streptomyces sp. NPDC101191]